MWQAPSGLLPFTTSPALPTGVNEEHLNKLAPPNGLFDGFGVLHSFFGRGDDALMLPDKLIPAVWITRDVHGDIMSIGSILRFNDDQRAIKPKKNVWLGELHPWPKPAIPYARSGSVVVTRNIYLQPAREQIPRACPHQCTEHRGSQGIFKSIWFR